MSPTTLAGIALATARLLEGEHTHTMSYALLDNDELLRLALDAVNHDRHAEGMTLLKELLQRDAAHVYGNYLLAAEHAQLGLLDAARQGFEKSVSLAPEFPMARFQLGQICLTLGDANAAIVALSPLADAREDTALAGYARGLIAAAQDRVEDAVDAIRTGLARPQEFPVLASDMQRFADALASAAAAASALIAIGVPFALAAPTAAPTTLGTSSQRDHAGRSARSPR